MSLPGDDFAAEDIWSDLLASVAATTQGWPGGGVWSTCPLEDGHHGCCQISYITEQPPQERMVQRHLSSITEVGSSSSDRCVNLLRIVPGLHLRQLIYQDEGKTSSRGTMGCCLGTPS